MAINRTNLTDTVVTARKFVQYGSDIDTAKIKLRAIASAISSHSIDALMNAISNITIDSRITPEEKLILKEEWAKIIAAFGQAQSSASELGILESDEFKALMESYSNLSATLDVILYDMNSPSTVSNEFTITFNAYLSDSSAFNSYMIAVKEGIEDKFSAYGCFVDISPADITPEDTVRLSARIMNGTVDVTNKVASDIGADKAFNWEFSGTRNDEYYNEYAKGKRAIEVPASEIFASSRFAVRFYAELNVSSL